MSDGEDLAELSELADRAFERERASQSVDPKGALLRIASQAREAEIVRAAVEEHRDEVLRRIRDTTEQPGTAMPEDDEDLRRYAIGTAIEVLDCLVALCNGEQWPPKKEPAHE